jgi:hypothetical protein
VTTWDAVREEAPTIVVVAPCGYHLADASEQARAVLAELATTPAGRNNEVWAIDADAYLVRPGPRLVDGVELLSRITGTRLTRTRSPASADPANRSTDVTRDVCAVCLDCRQPALRKAGRPGGGGLKSWRPCRPVRRHFSRHPGLSSIGRSTAAPKACSDAARHVPAYTMIVTTKT